MKIFSSVKVWFSGTEKSLASYQHRLGCIGLILSILAFAFAILGTVLGWQSLQTSIQQVKIQLSEINSRAEIHLRGYVLNDVSVGPETTDLIEIDLTARNKGNINSGNWVAIARFCDNVLIKSIPDNWKKQSDNFYVLETSRTVLREQTYFGPEHGSVGIFKIQLPGKNHISWGWGKVPIIFVTIYGDHTSSTNDIHFLDITKQDMSYEPVIWNYGHVSNNFMECFPNTVIE